MPPRKRRLTPVERHSRNLTRFGFGTDEGRAESASPARRVPDPRITQGPGSSCPCPVSVRLCAPESSEQTLTWTQDSGQTQGETFDASTLLRLMHPPENNGSNQPWVWFEATHNYGKGTIHDFFVLDHVITPSELTGLTSPAGIPSSGLLLHWPMNEASGTTATDTSGNGNDGTYHGGVTLDGAKASFDGVDDYVDVPLALSGSALTTLTFGLWVAFDATGAANRTLLDRGSQTANTAVKIVPVATYLSLNNLALEIWGTDSGSGGYDLANAPPLGASEQLLVVSFDIDNLGQDSNSLGPRPKIRTWNTAAGVSCTLEVTDDVLLAGGDVTLPSAAVATNHIYYVKNVTGGTISVTPDGSDTIDGAASLSLGALADAIIVSDGTTGWWIL